MSRRSPTRRGRPDGGDLNDPITATVTCGSQRTAEDAVEQINETIVWLDAADGILCAALLNKTDLVEAAEHAVRLHGRARRCLELAVVE